MGAIMCIGVATANSILMITFANDQRKDHGMNAHDAALAAGLTRLRPVIMTALAMIIGMLPMSLGLGEGGEQNAPLGRAVIGGLTAATFATLFFVPVVYSAAAQAAAAPRRRAGVAGSMRSDRACRRSSSDGLTASVTHASRPTATATATRPAEAAGRRQRHRTDHDEIDLNVPQPRPVWVVVAGVAGVVAPGRAAADGPDSRATSSRRSCTPTPPRPRGRRRCR